METPLLVDDFLQRAARVYPDKIAIVDGSLRLSYADFERRVNQLSHALTGLGIGRGDRVCILSPNSHHFLESFYGTAQIGVILVPLNYRLVAEDHRYILDHAGVKAVLVDDEYTDVVDSIREHLDAVEHWIVARHAASSAREADQDDPPDSEWSAPDGWVDWEELIADLPQTPPDRPERSENDVVSINYTSGTTARPKGVMLTHRNCYINAYSLIAHLRVAHDDVELWTLPMFHCNGWGGVYALTGMGGTHVVLRTIDGERIFDLIEHEKVTFACMAPTVLRVILDYPDKQRHAITTRPRFTLAGAPPPAAYIERVEDELGWEFLQIYGLTETAPFVTSSQVDHATQASDYARRSRAGVPGIGVDVVLLDDDDNPVPRDGQTVGEICVCSNVVFKGYWKQPEETARVVRDGYFHTGDLAVWDAGYNVHVVDRKKDVVISGGENVSSPEVEDVLYQHPNVLECAVIGVPHEKWGETPKALVVLREGAASGNEPDLTTEDELLEFARERLAHFKCPTSVEFVEALPRTATGKLQKYRLREAYWKGHDRRVS